MIMGTYVAVFTCNMDGRCKERLEVIHFVPFSKPKTNKTKCVRWIKVCGRQHIHELIVDCVTRPILYVQREALHSVCKIIAIPRVDDCGSSHPWWIISAHHPSCGSFQHITTGTGAGQLGSAHLASPNICFVIIQ